jgi:hypothetical protein
MERKITVTFVIAVLALVLAISSLILSFQVTLVPQLAYKEPEEITLKTKHDILTLGQIAELQPGLGTVMIEYGNRYYVMYYAAKSGNWELAKYQLKEAREIQEVGEATRPERAPLLKAFEESYLDPLDKAIDAEDWSQFEMTYNKGIEGCNNCHATTGFPYIKFTLPPNQPELP